MSIKTQITDSTPESVSEPPVFTPQEANGSHNNNDETMDFENDGLDDGMLAAMDVEMQLELPQEPHTAPQASVVKKETLPGRLRMPTQVQKP